VPEDFVAADAGGLELSSRTQQGCPIAGPGRPAKIERRQAHLRREEEPEFGASAWVLIGGLLGNPLGLTSESFDLFALPGSFGRPRRQTLSTCGPCRFTSSPNAASSRWLAKRSRRPASLMGSVINSRILSENPRL